jgi:L-alanine-DL-glutamate epimerase-like enolase superfamily enzyme
MEWAPADLFVELPRFEDGLLRIPDRPGHGLALAPGAIEKYRLR